MSERISPFGDELLARSGLRHIGKVPAWRELSRAEAIEFELGARATRFTWDRYGDDSAVRAWEALAVHHDLEPGFLHLGRKGRLRYLRNVRYVVGEDSVLRRFLMHLPIVASSIERGSMPCIKCSADPLQSFVKIGGFKAYVAKHHVVSARSKNPTVRRTIARSTPLLDVVLDANDLMTPEVLGGKALPGEEPDLLAYAQHRGLNATEAQILKRIVQDPKDEDGGRPSNERLGRRAAWRERYKIPAYRPER